MHFTSRTLQETVNCLRNYKHCRRCIDWPRCVLCSPQGSRTESRRAPSGGLPNVPGSHPKRIGLPTAVHKRLKATQNRPVYRPEPPRDGTRPSGSNMKLFMCYTYIYDCILSESTFFVCS